MRPLHTATLGVLAAFVCGSLQLPLANGSTVSRCSSTDLYHCGPPTPDSSDSPWSSDYEGSVSDQIWRANRAGRVHPHGAHTHDMTAAELWQRTMPVFAAYAPPSSYSSLLVVFLVSFTFFSFAYLFSTALHRYVCDDLQHIVNIERIEQQLREHSHQEQQSNGVMASNFDPASHSAKKSLHLPVIQIIPAVQHSPSESCRRNRCRLLSPAFYWNFYFRSYLHASNRNVSNGIEWNSRLISNLHALISCVAGVICFMSSTSRIEQVKGNGSSDSNTFISSTSLYNPFSSHFTPSLLAFNEDYIRDVSLMITCGYLTYDLLLCLWVRWSFRSERQDCAVRVDENGKPRRVRVKIDDGLTLVHHVLILFAFAFGVYTHVGTYFMSCFLLNEASTFFVNANWFMALNQKWKQELLNGLAYKLNGMLLFGIFIVWRVLFNVYVLAVMAYTWYELTPLWLHYESPFLFTGVPPLPTSTLIHCILLSSLACGHVAINLVWFHALWKAIRRKLFRRHTKSD